MNITWKLAAEKIVHLDIKEGIKGPNDMISKHLSLDKDIYESLDEIIERYLKPCNSFVVQIREHKKFMDEDIEYVKQTLIDEKKNEPTLIPYYISFSTQIPQYLVLSYIPKHYDIKHEYIKIKPDGLLFHELKFTSIKKLIAWFKSKLKTPDYQKYVKHVQPPVGDLNAWERKRVKEEATVKQEGYGSRNERRGGRNNKDHMYKNNKFDKGGLNKQRRKFRDSDEENKGFVKPKKRGNDPWENEKDNWEADNIDENREWLANWNTKGKISQDKSKVKKEGSRSRSRSNEKNKLLRAETKGKKSAVSKHSFTSEILHNAWENVGGVGEETWDNMENSQDNWTKSEIKTENEHEWGHSTKNEEHSETVYKNQDGESNWN